MESSWTNDFEAPSYPKLEEDLSVDAVIVGGGIAGSVAAYALAKSGKRVVLIDKGSLEDSVTAYTTAFITYVVDTPLSQLISMFGEGVARDVWDSGRSAIDYIERLVKEEGMPCEFIRCPEYLIANGEGQWKKIDEDATTAKRMGFDVRQGRDGGPALANSGHALVSNQAKFHPLKFVAAVREKARLMGALVYERTEALEIKGERHVTVRTPGGTISASHCLVATYDPANRPKELFAHKGMYMSYVCELALPPGKLAEGLYIDQDNPYHYLRVDSKGDRDRAILGGADHRREIPLPKDRQFDSVLRWFEKAATGIDYSVVRKWDGPILETVDGLPYIGTYSDEQPKIFVATGFSGNGMTYGVTAARMFTDFVNGSQVRWKAAFDPKRDTTLKNLASKGKDYAEEFWNGTVKSLFRKK